MTMSQITRHAVQGTGQRQGVRTAALRVGVGLQVVRAHAPAEAAVIAAGAVLRLCCGAIGDNGRVLQRGPVPRWRNVDHQQHLAPAPQSHSQLAQAVEDSASALATLIRPTKQCALEYSASGPQALHCLNNTPSALDIYLAHLIFLCCSPRGGCSDISRDQSAQEYHSKRGDTLCHLVPGVR